MTCPRCEHQNRKGCVSFGRAANRARHRWLLAHAYLLGSRPDDARKAAEEALELARRYGERGNEAEALRVLGECAAGGRRRA